MTGEVTRIPRKTYLQKIKELGLNLPEDRRLLYMSAVGMSNRAMRAHLGMTNGQITYRLKKWREAGYREANRQTWRDGTGKLAKQAILKIDAIAEMEITREIERNLPRFLLK